MTHFIIGFFIGVAIVGLVIILSRRIFLPFFIDKVLALNLDIKPFVESTNKMLLKMDKVEAIVEDRSKEFTVEAFVSELIMQTDPYNIIDNIVASEGKESVLNHINKK